MNSEMLMFTYSSEEEVTIRDLYFFREVLFIKNRGQATRPTRNIISRDRYGTHDRLFAAYFSVILMYDEYPFRKREGISPLMKCTSTIRQLTYDNVLDALDKYLQTGEATARLSLDNSCKAVMDIFGAEYS
ncbi:hypothetical protein Tco_1564587 [Tanacetum coccineum]